MKMKINLLIGMMFLSLFVLLFVACDEDEGETDKPYVGKWNSTEYTNLSSKTEQMKITLTNNTFEDHILQADSTEPLAEKTAIKGNVTFVSDGNLAIEITDISLLGTPYVNRLSDSAGFYYRWNLSVGVLMDINITPTYVLTNNNSTMSLLIPLKEGAPITHLPLTLSKQ